MAKRIRFQIRPMLKGDLDRVIEIENRCFQQPYSREIFEQEFKIKAAYLRVATYRGKIIAYIDFWLVSDEVELISIAVDPSFKRRAVGEGLMKMMLKFAKQNGAKFLYLDVRASNTSAQKLYQKFGFAKVGVRRRYYSDNQEDAWMMKRVLD